jgi:hemerythrin-like domain-containing protein
MKRHQSLQPLSRDHHHALVKAAFLCSLGSEKNPSSPQAAAQIIVSFWHDQLQHHFREEEDFLLPILARFSTSDHPEIVKTLIDHVDIRSRIDQLNYLLETTQEIDAELLKSLGLVIHDHVRFEEAHLFNTVEQLLSESELLRMNRFFAERK